MILKMKRNKSTYRSLVRRIQSKNRIPTLDDIYILFDIGIIGSTYRTRIFSRPEKTFL